MAKRYREFKRVPMGVATAKKLEELLVDRTLNDHFGLVDCTCTINSVARPDCAFCNGTGELPKCQDKDACYHVESGSLAVARLVESGLRVSKKRAYLDIPDDPETVKILADRLKGFSERAGRSGTAFLRIAKQAASWAARGPLERLAEAGLELD
jgi:hypothetical protein